MATNVFPGSDPLLVVLVLVFFVAIALAVTLAIVVVIAQGQAKKAAWKLLDQPEADSKDIKNVVKRLGMAKDNESKELSRKLMDRLTST